MVQDFKYRSQCHNLKAGIADTERVNKTLNGKLRIINNGNNQQLKQLKKQFSLIIY